MSPPGKEGGPAEESRKATGWGKRTKTTGVPAEGVLNQRKAPVLAAAR